MNPPRCLACTARISPRTSPVSGTEPRCARGLCTGCYGRKRSRDRHLDFPARLRSRDSVMEEWEMLRGQGYNKRQAAERLGMTFAAFDRAYCRARAAGDARAYVTGRRLVAA